jgi:predicted permease
MALRDRLIRWLRPQAWPPKPHWPDGGQWRWVYRGLRARGWSGALGVGVVAVALAANAIVFATADAVVFHRVPYPDPDRLIQIQNGALPPSPWSAMSTTLMEAWAHQTDLIAGVAGYGVHTEFVVAGTGTAEPMLIADLTSGTLGVLGVAPRWGRPLDPSDTTATGEHAVLVSEELARARFGDPAAAVGQPLDTTGTPLRIVGVMPKAFRFPSAAVEIWQTLDPKTTPAGILPAFARLAPGLDPRAAASAIAARGAAVAEEAGISTPYKATIAPLVMSRATEAGRQISLVLLGAAACLLLTACANAASLELAFALRRARVQAVQLALGAPRTALLLVAGLEAAVQAIIAAALAAGLTWLGTRVIAAILPTSLGFDLLSAVSVDNRTLTLLAAMTGVVWFLTSLPILLHASRASVVGLLGREGRSQSSSPAGAWLRRILTVAQVALAVCLLVGSVLYVRTYLARLAEDKGFDSRNLASLDITLPPEMQSRGEALSRELPDRIGALPGVLTLVAASSPAEGNRTARSRAFEVDGRALDGSELRVARKQVPANYFSAIGIPLLAGREFGATDPSTSVIISESFARQFWPGGAVGHTFRHGAGPTNRIIGVVGHVRAKTDGWQSASNHDFLVYQLASPPGAAGAGAGTRGAVNFTIRLDSPARLTGVVAAVRAMVRPLPVSGELVDDAYAAWAGDALFATRLVSAFGGLSFLVAMVGLYGVVAFLVTARRREIGIRMALGADARAIRGLVLGSSLRLVIVGAGCGVLLALAASHAVRSQLVGVAATDPLTYAMVFAAMSITALAASLGPARRAARVDPVVTLRAE